LVANTFASIAAERREGTVADRFVGCEIPSMGKEIGGTSGGLGTAVDQIWADRDVRSGWEFGYT
jgi:hypothetical protein